MLKPTTKEVDKIIGRGKKAETKLLKPLTTEDKGIVAHYILSNIYKETSYQILHMDSLTFETKEIDILSFAKSKRDPFKGLFYGSKY